MSPADFARWRAAQMILGQVAPLANEAAAAAARVPTSDTKNREYAITLAEAMEAYRDNLLAALKRLAPRPEPKAPPGHPSAPQAPQERLVF